jgi:lipopolysaccharide transport system ATP-binding protein
MSDVVIRVENIGKRYILGKGYSPAITFWGRARQSIAGTFDWLTQQIKGPSPDQILWALKNVSFEVKKGEVLGVIGPNGAGKSTLLKLLTRITEPTEGFAEIIGRVGSLLEVGTGMHPELTGRENIYLNATILGMTKKEVDAKFDEIVDFSGIEKFIDTPVKRYSSGMNVRLGFAIAAHLEPEIIMVDEVLAVGDAEFQKKCLGKMQDVASYGRTVIFVSHNMGSITSLCSRCMLLRNGELLLDTEPQKAILEHLKKVETKETTLLERTDRRGAGKVKITKISFLETNSQQEVLSVTSDTNLTIKIKYHSQLDSPILKLNIGLAVYNNSGQMVTIFNSQMASQKYHNLPHESTLQCIVPKIALMPGSYYFKPTLFVNERLEDQVESAAVLNIEQGDFYGTSVTNSSAKGAVFIEHHWEY